MKKLFSKITASVLSALLVFTNTPLNIVNAEDNLPESFGMTKFSFIDENGNELIPNLVPDFDLRALNLPEKFDLRDYGYITSVKNQGSTGTCWAHSALASIESNMIMKGLADNSIDLSEAHLVWFGKCAYSTDENDPLYHEGYNYGKDGYNQGGHSLLIQNVLSRGTGVQLESNFPNVTKKPSIDESKRYTSYGYLTNSDELDPTDFDSIKQHIMSSGALLLSYCDATENGKNPYMSSGYGIYCPENKSPNHGVTIVGWDDNFDDFIDTPKGKGAWIVKNSWGTSQGDEGYFYISYYDKTIERITSFEVESTDKFDNIYQYDGISTFEDGKVSYIYSEFSSNGISAANIFSAKGNEEITSVSFYTQSASMPYTISIYTNVTEGKPTSGNLIYTQDGSALYAGYHLIDLGKAVSVKKDTKFSVVVTLKKGGAIFYTDTNASSENSSFYAEYSLFTKRNGTWNNLNKKKSVDACIKAFSKSTDTYIPNCSKTGQHIYGDWTNNAESHSRTCSECKKTETFSHSFANWIDNDDGTHMRICLDCGYSENEKHILGKLTSDDNSTHSESCTVCNYINKNEHSFTKWQDSKDGANHTKKCTVCNQTVTEKHNMSNWIDNGDGTHSRSCTVCGYTETENHAKSSIVADNNLMHSTYCSLCGYVNKSEHNFTEWKDEENGKHFKKCLDCNFSTSEKHSFTEYTDNKDGTHSRSCKICKYSETEKHSLNPLSADNDSTHSESCTLCGYVNKSEHNFGNWINNNDGINHIKKCKDCGHSVTEKHIFTEWTDDGNDKHSRNCTVCSHSETAEHSFGSYLISEDRHIQLCKYCGGTFGSSEHSFRKKSTTDTSHTLVCYMCEYEVTTEHDFTDWEIINDKKHSHYCRDCLYEIYEEHSFDDWKDNEDGTHSRSCTVCGYSSKAEHNFPDWKSNKNGEHYHYCTDCKKYESEKHDFVRTISQDGTITSVCSVCGYEETSKVEFIRGDMDGSKKIDVFDMILMRMAYINGLKNDTDILSADMNGDGKFNISDLVSLNKFILNG